MTSISTVFSPVRFSTGETGRRAAGNQHERQVEDVVRAVEAARRWVEDGAADGARDDGERGGVSPWFVRSFVVHTRRAHRPPVPPLLRGGSSGSGRVPLLRMVDVAICVPSDNTQHIQEAHIAIEHVICFLVERARFGDRPAATI